MTNHRSIVVVCLTLILLSCKSATDSHFKGYLVYLDELGYSIYNPPRTDRGPLSVFAYQVAESGKIVLSPVCRKLFNSLDLEFSDLSIPSVSKNDKFNASFALDPVKDILKEPISLDSNLLANTEVTAKFGNTKELYISEEDLFNENGLARSITPQCFSALSRRSKNNTLDNVFVIQSAIQVDSISYDLSNVFTASVSAEAQIKKALNLDATLGTEKLDKTTLESNSPRFVAFQAFKIVEYVDTGLTTAGSAVVKMERLKL